MGHGLTGRPNECSMILQEGTTVLLEDSVSRRDPNWIFYSSGDYHGLSGRPNRCSMLFWEAPPSYWKTLSPGEIPTGSSTLLEITTILLEDQMNVLFFFRKAPPSYWKTLSPKEIPTGFSTLPEITTVFLEDQMNVLCFFRKAPP